MDTGSTLFIGGLILLIVVTLFNLWWSVSRAAAANRRIDALEAKVNDLNKRQPSAYQQKHFYEEMPTANQQPAYDAFGAASQKNSGFSSQRPGNLTDEQYNQIVNVLPTNKIEAIKLYRQFTLTSLKEAKDAVDAMGDRRSS